MEVLYIYQLLRKAWKLCGISLLNLGVHINHRYQASYPCIITAYSKSLDDGKLGEK